MFFILPDAWTSWRALRSPRRGLATTVSALAGALAGGVVTYRWGARTDGDRSRELLARLPGITPAMVDEVETDLCARGARALMDGSRSGMPYKLYARAAGLHGLALGEFLAWSVPARMSRFVAFTGGAAALRAVSARVLPATTGRLDRWVFGAGWLAGYTAYFRGMARRERARTESAGVDSTGDAPVSGSGNC